MPLHHSCNFCELPECQITAQNQQQKTKELDTRSPAKSLKLKKRVA